MNAKPNVKTIADIARLAGVSTSTASRALRDSDLISIETKERIKKIAQEHSFRPHLGARNLRLKKSNSIVLVFPFDYADQDVLVNPYIFKVLGTVGSALRARHYDLLLSRLSDINMLIDDLYIHSGLAEGAIILGRGDNDQSKMAALVETNIPFVVLGPEHDNQGYCSVGIDNRQSSRMAVKHLAKQGRKRIAIISDNFDEPIAEGYQRYQGYLQGLADAGLPFDQNLTVLSTYAGQSGYDAIQLLLESVPDFDAIFVATSDIVAIGAMQALHDANKRIPQDVALVGFDNIDLCDFTNPPLTSISQRLHEGVADLLTQKLLDQIAGQQVESTMLQGRLVVRQSCGASVLT